MPPPYESFSSIFISTTCIFILTYHFDLNADINPTKSNSTLLIHRVCTSIRIRCKKET